ncbi:MAG: LytTR family DNA-binding domain-containing protein [Clostridiaceae bacterium]
MFNILVIEDDIYQRENLKAMIKESGAQYNVLEADSKEAALRISEENKIDLFFVDVELKNSSGLDFAREIREKRNYKLSWIVFVTTHVNYMMEAFKEVHCYDYLIKPYEKSKVRELIEVLLENIEKDRPLKEDKKFIIIKSNGIEVKQYLEDVIFIEVLFKKIMLHTVWGIFEVNNMSLDRMKELTAGSNIIQCHRSYLINTDFVEKVDKSKLSWEVFFKKTSERALVSRSYRKAFEEAFKKF